VAEHLIDPPCSLSARLLLEKVTGTPQNWLADCRQDGVAARLNATIPALAWEAALLNLAWVVANLAEATAFKGMYATAAMVDSVICWENKRFGFTVSN
jgi:hypothetical protein